MNLENIVKASPAYWIVAFIVTVGAGTVYCAEWLDNRYLRVTDAASIKQELRIQSQKTDMLFLKNRKSNLEDKIFEIEVKKKPLSETEAKQLLRYKSEHEDVVREMQDIARLGSRGG